jgi:oligopeptide/dipeptide ABC transporter ATP-binding protein
MVKIILKICFLSLLFINQAFAQQAFAQQAFVQQDFAQQKQAVEEVIKPLSTPPTIASSINPIHQIAKFISGDDKSNSLLINPKTSEHDYQFRVSNINTLNKVDVAFYISDNLENHFAKALNSLKKQPHVVQLAKSKHIKLLTFQSRVDEDSTDYHIWLSPDNAIGMATEIAETLSALYPPSIAKYQKNLKRFIADIKNMDKENQIKLLNVRAKSFIVDHNSIVYFENYYDIHAAGAMRHYHSQELLPRDIERINNLIKGNRSVCVLGSFQERSGVVGQIAMNNKAKLALIDIMGNERNYKKNGYTEMMKDLVDEFHMGIIFITHDLGVVAQTADKVAVMYLGRMIEQGPVRDVIRTPQHPYTQGLLDALPKLDDLGAPLTPVAGDIPSPLERPPGCVFHTRCPKIIGDICTTHIPQWAQTGENHRTACHLCTAKGEAA